MIARTADNQTERNTPGGMAPNVRVLIVDDGDALRSLHETVLSIAGYCTGSAADGAEAMEMLAAEDFDLVVTDCDMPRLDGIGLIRAMRSAGIGIPVMMLSGSLSDGGLPADVRDEIAVALPKPARPGDLLAGVANALRWNSALPAQTRNGDTSRADTATRRKARIELWAER
jgi:DNA-binding response OmpR family regulator